uniref:Metallophos domain-containing protein n=1 Tax=Panagrellus redivivus TaxID=6233 RepID=A0A7E4ZQL3_PANRE
MSEAATLLDAVPGYVNSDDVQPTTSSLNNSHDTSLPSIGGSRYIPVANDQTYYEKKQQPSTVNFKSAEKAVLHLDSTLSDRFLASVDYVEAKIFANMPRHLIALFVIFEFVLMAIRFLVQALGYPLLSRVLTIVFVEVSMLAGSTFLFKRMISIPGRTKKSEPRTRKVRQALGLFALVWIVLAHSCWVLFYVPLPGDLFIAVLSFLAMGAYIHFMIMIFLLFFVEQIVHLIFPRMSHPLLKSESIHTIVAVMFALLLSIHGATITAKRPVLKTVNVGIHNLPPELDGFSIALITDVHIGPTVGTSRINEIVEVINEAQTDVVTISGDLVDGFVDFLRPRAMPLAKLRSRFGTYLALGNHEFFHESVDNWVRFFHDELNITTLGNTGVVLDKAGKKLCLAGVDDLYTESIHLNGHKMDAAAALHACPNHTTTVMLVHQPNGAGMILDALPKIPGSKQIDLILSGHTHAGQMYVIYPLSYLTNTFFYGHYTHAASGAQIYVSSGVNYWGPPIKMPNLCEIVKIQLHPA